MGRRMFCVTIFEQSYFGVIFFKIIFFRLYLYYLLQTIMRVIEKENYHDKIFHELIHFGGLLVARCREMREA